MPSKELAFTFGVGPLALRCQFESGLTAVVRSFVQPVSEVMPSASGGGPTLLVSARRGAATSPASRGLPLTCGFGGSAGYTEPGRLELWDGSSLVTAELDGRTVHGELGSESDPHFIGAVMLFVATALAMRAHALFHLHAGCVDVPGLGTVLIVGESGCGKTTLSVGLCAHEGRLVSDDAVFLCNAMQGRNIEVWGWPADLHVAPATLRAFPDLARHANRLIADGRDKRALPLAGLAAPWLPVARSPRFVLFPRVGSAATSSARRLDPAETVTRLIPQSGLAVVSGAAKCAEHLRLLADLADIAVGIEVTLGADALPPSPAFVGLLRESCDTARGGSDAKRVEGGG